MGLGYHHGRYFRPALYAKFEQLLPQNMFMYRRIITIMVVAFAVIHVLIPTPYRIITLVVCIFIISIQMFLYGYREYRIFKRRRKNIYNHKHDYKTGELDDKTKSMVLDWTSRIEKKYKIVITEKVQNFQSKFITKTISINPNVLKNSDPIDNEASFYHEIGHMIKFEKFTYDLTLLTPIIGAYSLLIIIDIARGEIPLIPMIGTFGVFLLIKTWTSWRNEYRADKFALEKVGAENLKIMFDSMTFRYDSESHPSPDKRWMEIKKFLNLQNFKN